MWIYGWLWFSSLYIICLFYFTYVCIYIYVCLSIYFIYPMYYLYIFKNINYAYVYIDRDTYLSWIQTYLQNIIYVWYTLTYVYTHICLLWQVSLLIISFHICVCVYYDNKLYNQSSATLLEGNKLSLPLSLIIM